jgi:hypothetical protein
LNRSRLGYTLYAGLGVTDGAWLFFWLYCASDGTLGRFYGERTDAVWTLNQPIQGSCNEESIQWDMPDRHPAISPVAAGLHARTSDGRRGAGDADADVAESVQQRGPDQGSAGEVGT